MTKLWSKIHIHLLTYIMVLLAFLMGFFKYVVIILSIIVIHELGHIITSLLFKRKFESIYILPFGGLIKFDSLISSNIFEDLLIAVSGIGTQLILGITVNMFKNYINFYDLFKYYNTIIIGFNLFPLYPLDGYKILKCFSELIIPFKKTFILCFVISLFVLIGIILYKNSLFMDNIVVFVFIIVMSLMELKNVNYILNRFYLERLIYEFNYKVKRINDIKDMYKNRLHIIKGMNEKEVIMRKYSCKQS